jgi:glycine/D-amino acid oxidase-like deaminating enzyme
MTSRGISRFHSAVGWRCPFGSVEAGTKIWHWRCSRAPGFAGLYIAVTHSGIILALAIGHFVADELLMGVRDDLIKPYGLDRIL